MQLRRTKNAVSLRVAVIAAAILILAAIIVITGCGDDHHVLPTKTLFVADLSNNRVLLYAVPFATGESASTVLGQADFTSSAAALSASGLSGPETIALDASGNAYVTDFSNCRVVQFTRPFTNGMSASVVLGEPNLTTAACALTQGGMGNPVGAAFDASGNLWVAIQSQNRVLQYKPPFTNGMNASLVIGQADFTSNGAATTNSGLIGPRHIAFDPQGNLWVADNGNHRVLQFKPPFSNGMAASVVLGQADFTSAATGTTQNRFSSIIRGLAVDSSGNVWVGDVSNNRVLQFKPAFANDMNASVVIGQPDFTTSTAIATQNGLNFPGGLAFDSSDKLFVTEQSNHRTTVFAPPFTSGMNATLVLGQTNFTSSGAATTATGQSTPIGAGTSPF